MFLDSLAEGNHFALPELGIDEAVLISRNRSDAKVRIIRGPGAGDTHCWSIGTEIRPCAKPERSNVPVSEPRPLQPEAVLASKMVEPIAPKEIVMSTATTKFSPNANQHKVLVHLLKVDNFVARGSIKEDVFDNNGVNMKSIMTPLVEAKLVNEKIIEQGGRKEPHYKIFADGKKAALKPAPAARIRGDAVHQPLPKVGGTFTKVYKDREITVKVVEGGFQIGKEVYKSLTAAAKAVRDSDGEVNGWLFFGLTK